MDTTYTSAKPSILDMENDLLSLRQELFGMVVYVFSSFRNLWLGDICIQYQRYDVSY